MAGLKRFKETCLLFLAQMGGRSYKLNAKDRDFEFLDELFLKLVKLKITQFKKTTNL